MFDRSRYIESRRISFCVMTNLHFTLIKTDGERDRNGPSSGKVYQLLLVSKKNWSEKQQADGITIALQYPYVIAFEPTFVEIHHVETGHLVQIIPGNNISCSFADTPPSRVNAPVPPPNRQLMYPPQSTNQFRPPTFNSRPSYPAYGAQPGFPPGQGMIRPPQPMPAQPQQAAYGMPPMPVIPRFARPQVIFTSEDGHVQFLKYSPAPTVSSTARPPVSMPGHRMSH